MLPLACDGAGARPENTNRARLLQAVRDQPGITRRQLSRTLGLAPGTVLHHLDVLRRAGRIVEHRTTKIPCYATASHVAAATAVPWDALRHPVGRALLMVLRARGPGSSQEIREAWTRLVPTMAPPRPDQVSRQCGRLQAAGLLARQRTGHRVVWMAVGVAAHVAVSAKAS
jgi:DNA-binding transcriptional ArsR family regulator